MDTSHDANGQRSSRPREAAPVKESGSLTAQFGVIQPARNLMGSNQRFCRSLSRESELRAAIDAVKSGEVKHNEPQDDDAGSTGRRSRRPSFQGGSGHDNRKFAALNRITWARVEKIKEAAGQPGFHVISEQLEEISEFYFWVLEKFGYLVRLWRALDRDFNMSLTHSEFLTGLRKEAFPGNARHLMKIFDLENTGILQYRCYDPAGALHLAHFKAWATEKYGSLEGAFSRLDEDGSGKLTMNEFRAAAKKHGLLDHCPGVSASTLFHMFKPDDSHTWISKEELLFLAKWRDPEWLRVEPDVEGAEEFKRKLIKRFDGNEFLAWCHGLDDQWSMSIRWEDFLKKSLSSSQRRTRRNSVELSTLVSKNQEDLLRIWRALDPNLSGQLSLREFSQNAYDLLTYFKQYCVKNYGSIEKMMIEHDENESGMLSRKEFFTLVAPKLQNGKPDHHAYAMTDGELEMLFVGLDRNGGDTVKTSEIEILDKWDCESDVKWERLWDVVFNSLCPPLGEPLTLPNGEPLSPPDVEPSSPLPLSHTRHDHSTSHPRHERLNHFL